MATADSSVPAHPSTRELRALELFHERGRDIERLSENVYRVPSQDGQRSYDVLYGDREECPCPDFEFHGGPCKHLMAVGVLRAKRRGATLRSLTALEDQLAHELMDDDERQEFRDRVLALRWRLARGERRPPRAPGT
jgi:hypothetical protein